MNNKMIIRQATKADSRRIAEFYSISSDGVADYIWMKLAEPGQPVLDVGEQRYARENTDFSYQNCKLVERNGEAVAMLVAFPMHVDPDYIEDDRILKPYSLLEEDNSYYICGIAVEKALRGQGIGKLLMNEAELDARAKGFEKLSLVVFEQNRVALDLYKRLGYKEVMRQQIIPHPLIHYTGYALLMVKMLG